MRVVLDAEAVNALVQRDHPGQRTVRQALEAARRLRRDAVVPTVTLAELYRGAGRDQGLDALLARESEGLALRDTDRGMARLVGAVLATAQLGSERLVDAHAVAAAVEVGGGVVLTGDCDDIARLAAPYRTVVVETIPGSGDRRSGRRH